MNSDKIERLQRASAMTAPEASRSTETPFLRPCCASTWTKRRDASHWDCATWGFCASRWDLAICLCFFGTLRMWKRQRWNELKKGATTRNLVHRRWSGDCPAFVQVAMAVCGTPRVCVCVCVLHLGKKEVCSPPSVKSHKVWHRVWSRRADNESCIAFISALAVVSACARDPWTWPFPFQPTSALFPPSLFQ